MRLVERNMPVAAQTQQLNVARELFEERVIAGALLCLVLRHAVFNVRVLGIYVQPVEQVLAHEIRIALRVH